MRTDWVPSKDQDLDNFALNFSTKLTAAPTSYGLVAGDATAFASLRSDFATKLAAATAPATATSVTVASKNTSRASLTAGMRSLARRVQSYSAITSSLLSELGLTVRDTVATPIPAPSTKPTGNVQQILSREHVIAVADSATPTSKARPFGASGYQVFYSVAGDTDGGDVENMHFEGVGTKATFSISYPSSAVGKVATIRLRWMNRKGEVGPVSDPITSTVAA